MLFWGTVAPMDAPSADMLTFVHSQQIACHSLIPGFSLCLWQGELSSKRLIIPVIHHSGKVYDGVAARVDSACCVQVTSCKGGR